MPTSVPFFRSSILGYVLDSHWYQGALALIGSSPRGLACSMTSLSLTVFPPPHFFPFEPHSMNKMTHFSKSLN